ncbi:MAG: hypothetical protein QXF79_02105, partial [Ignisphaera sp.]
MKNQNVCTWDKDKFLRLLATLAQEYKVDINEFVISVINNDKANFFEALVAIILSQNTNDKNAINAFNNLRAAMGIITPQKIINMSDNEVKALIKVAGLVNRRAKALKELAMIFIKKPGFFNELAFL